MKCFSNSAQGLSTKNTFPPSPCGEFHVANFFIIIFGFSRPFRHNILQNWRTKMYRQKKGRGVGGKEKAPLKSQGEIWEICGRLKNCLEKKSDSSQSVRQKNCCPCTRPSPHFPSGPPSKPAGAGSRIQPCGSDGKKTPRNFSKLTLALLDLQRTTSSDKIHRPN